MIDELKNSKQQPVWSCAFNNPSSGLPYADRCADNSKLNLLYATALHAPTFTLPDGVGIKLPKNRHLVMQTHSNRTLADNAYSGLRTKVSTSDERYAGVSNFILTHSSHIFPITTGGQ